ncbi:patatin-like phospholipase family protein [Halobacteriales archaeon Cl-PHB]
MSEPTKVAIACQGGGSHTAFTAGVLQELLESWDRDRYELVGISGTSGGAFNALGTWYGLVTGDEDDAAEVLEKLWADIAADGPTDRLLNTWLSNLSRLESSGLPMPSISPYQLPGPNLGSQRIREILDRHVDFDAIPGLCQQDAPELVVGTVDVNGGYFETFTNEEVTTEAVLASAAVPNLFEAVEINGHDHWDGLFSQNPPINDLLSVPAHHKPDELWVIQINPQVQEETPRTLEEIADRRNELAGNISLNQELKFVERVNDWVEAGHLPEDEFSKTSIRRIPMDRQYHCSTKVDRSAEFVAELTDLGRQRGAEFLDEQNTVPASD